MTTWRLKESHDLQVLTQLEAITEWRRKFRLSSLLWVQRWNSHTVAFGDENKEEKYGCTQLFLDFQGPLLALLMLTLLMLTAMLER